MNFSIGFLSLLLLRLGGGLKPTVIGSQGQRTIRASSPFLSFFPIGVHTEAMVTGSVPSLGPASGCQESSR